MASGGGRRQRQAKPRARARGKAKRTKYLSLSDLMVNAEVAATPTPPEDEPASPRSPWEEEEEAEVKREEDAGGDRCAGWQQQVEPFALHHHNEASTLFEALPAPSLSDILGPSPSASPDGAGSGASGLPGAQEEDLARRALRGRERWVYCSSPAATATATTSSSSPCSSAASTGASAARSLLLKLDYEEILAAWADRGSLYIGAAGASGGGGGSPELQLDAVQLLVEVEPPEHAVTAPSGRAERVRRYKEKRRRRLFAKRIRYEVRRLNAVKRPRFKGRFIKENEESELQPT
ncbi:zinc finger protein CONSTANS-LIKE 3-like [Miscanthus floridulus]|uniref:zinc finger protein CONSTANS-LIKE 3-like n=1 Tax=Miscanthus floridulus TaxID=154761 RepID=UPI003457FB84